MSSLSLQSTVANPQLSDDDDDVPNNPMVATFQDDVDTDSEDDLPTKVTPVKMASADVQLSSDEDDNPQSSKLESEPEDGLINKLSKQFNDTIGAGDNKELSTASPSDSSDHSDNDVQQPVIMSYTEELSDSDVGTTAKSPVSSNLVSRLSSKVVVLTDSEDERPTELAKERSSSIGESQVSYSSSTLTCQLQQSVFHIRKIMRYEYLGAISHSQFNVGNNRAYNRQPI